MTRDPWHRSCRTFPRTTIRRLSSRARCPQGSLGSNGHWTGYESGYSLVIIWMVTSLWLLPGFGHSTGSKLSSLETNRADLMPIKPGWTFWEGHRVATLDNPNCAFHVGLSCTATGLIPRSDLNPYCSIICSLPFLWDMFATTFWCGWTILAPLLTWTVQTLGL